MEKLRGGAFFSLSTCIFEIFEEESDDSMICAGLVRSSRSSFLEEIYSRGMVSNQDRMQGR